MDCLAVVANMDCLAAVVHMDCLIVVVHMYCLTVVGHKDLWLLVTWPLTDGQRALSDYRHHPQHHFS